MAAIALGVALGFAVQLINQAAIGELTAGVRALAGEADLEVRGGRAGFPEGLYATLARLPGVAVASPVLELEVPVAGTRRSLRVIGLDPLRAGLLQPVLFAANPGQRLALLQPDTAIAAAGAGLGEGETLRLVSGLKVIELQVRGVLGESSLRGAAVLADLSTVQWRFERLGELTRVDLRLAPGIDREAMRARIAPLLPAGVHVSGLDAVEESGAQLSRAYRVNLNVLALVALFTGGFLVFSAQALEVARRRREHALLRVLGLEQRGLARLVMAEAATLGALGGVLGVALGYGLARIAARVGGADLGAGYFRGVVPEIEVPAAMVFLYVAGGVAIALAGAWLPARDAARAAPAQALKAGDEQRLFERAARLWPGGVLLAAGLGLAFLPAWNGIPLGGYAAIACLLLGGILLMPFVAGRFFALLQRAQRRTSAVPALLATAQLRGAPGQAAVSLAAIVASFSLMVAMATMVASFRASVDDWLGAVLPADLYFRTQPAGETGWFDPAFEARVRSLEQVERAVFLRSTRIVLDPARPPVTLLARDDAGSHFPILGRAYAPRPGDPPPAWISEAVAQLYRLRPGDRMALPLAGRAEPFVVAAVWRDYARQHGAIVIARDVYARATGDARANDAALWLKPGAGEAAVTAALRALPGGELLDVAGPGEIRRTSLAIFDRSFAVTYALEAVAVLVGLFGLSSSVAAIVLARRREFGVLRHLGMTRRQVSAMLAAEGGLLALLGVAVGLALGGAMSLVLIHVVNRQSFNWSMEVYPPWGLLAILSAALVFLAVFTAWLSGREATGMAPVRAVKEDW